MPLIHLTTFIEAPVQKVFDLSRDISWHEKSMKHTGEKAVAGVTMGLINLGESVTWKAKHVGKQRYLTMKITEMQAPNNFTNEMTKGDFKSIKHQHFFKSIENGTLMIDLFEFKTPYGVVGSLFNQLYLTNYLKRLLELRNKQLKEAAERH
ncbi:MAG: SRPBCC family protein [Chitinophagaceae bacterium]|jgi:ligand-binding SRPBCC domain-containing protein|nr:SRPBCC family protein [Chitinophagaceae bacterium]